MPVRDQQANAIAGLSVAGLVLPESIAYASIAGLPPVHALLAALAGLLIYPLIGRSRFAIVSPTSASAAVLAAALASLGAVSPVSRVILLPAIIGCVGLLFLGAGLLRLGFAVAFVSRPVLRGFAFGLAVSIILRQLFAVTGIPVSPGSVLAQLVYVLGHAGAWNLSALFATLTALTALLLFRRYTRIPAALGVLVIAALLSSWIDFPKAGIPVIGKIAFVFATPTIPRLATQEWLRVASASLPLALVIFVEAWGTCRTLALRHGDSLSPNRELVAIGLANLAGASIGGQPVGAGFSASSANETAGATGRLAGLIAALVLAALALFALPLIARVPSSILAAIVVGALIHALDPRPLVRLWQIDRDQYVALVAALGVLMLGALDGMLLAVGLSVLAIVRRLADPSIDRLGQLPGTSNYVDVLRHPEAKTDDAILVVRPSEPLFFANAERIMTAIEAMAGDDVRTIVVSLELSDDLDSTSLEALSESATRLRARGQRLQFGRVKDPVRELMASAGGALKELAADSCRSVIDAVVNAKAKLGQQVQS
ncbi:MAG TPA: SulP family inorganic anion transporter [Sphingomicrobium sp.]|nr:SulP family inorganic anion transporter [Sphingomicrobium sp.]